MKHHLVLALPFLGLFSCNQTVVQNRVLQNRVDSLETRIAQTYKPGFGEFMSGVQAHHSKLWFAGLNENWKLADFEIQEIKETLEDLQKFDTNRKEIKLLGMIYPAMDSVNRAIERKDPVLFKRSFMLLTKTCNDCHSAAGFEFNVIKIPEASPFSNQDFRSGATK